MDDLLEDLGPRLRALTADQPAQPGDRVPDVNRRAGRIRRNRALVAAAGVVALLAPAGVLATSLRGHDEATDFASTNPLTWPDRSYPDDRTVAQSAVTQWHAFGPESGPVTEVRWLFRGRLAVAPATDRYAAVFTATRAGRHWLVAAGAVRSQLDDPALQGAGWDLSTVDLSAHPDMNHVGLYLPVLDVETSSVPRQRFTDHLSALFLLAAPGVGQIRWESENLPFSPRTGGASGIEESADGVFAIGPRPLPGPVTVHAAAVPGGRTDTYTLGLPGDYPFIVHAPDPDVPVGFTEVGSGAEQSRLQDGSWSLPGFSDSNDFGARAISLFARCYGGGVMHLSATSFDMTHDAEGNRAATSPESTVAAIDVPCDGKTHEAFHAKQIPRNTLLLRWTTDRLQALAYSYGYAP